MNICKNKCLTEKSVPNTKIGIYDNGYRFCCECVAYFKTDKVFCLCCGMRMRTKGRNLIRKDIITTMGNDIK